MLAAKLALAVSSRAQGYAGQRAEITRGRSAAMSAVVRQKRFDQEGLGALADKSAAAVRAVERPKGRRISQLLPKECGVLERAGSKGQNYFVSAVLQPARAGIDAR